MNTIQKRILISAVAVLTGMLVYPPFHYLAGNGAEFNMGYSWIFNPPEEYEASVNIPMLLVQWVCVAIIGTVAFFLASDSAGRDRSPGLDGENARELDGSKTAHVEETSIAAVAATNRTLKKSPEPASHYEVSGSGEGKSEEALTVSSKESAATTPDRTGEDQAYPKNEAVSKKSISPGYAGIGSNNGPTGVGGWLLFLVILMMAVVPLRGMQEIGSGFRAVEEEHPQVLVLQEWKTSKSLITIATALLSVLSFYGGMGLAIGRNRSVVTRAIIVLWIVGPIGVVILWLIIPAAVFGEQGLGGSEFIGMFFGSSLVATFWTIYLRMSRRVRNTFKEQGAGAEVV